MRDANGLQYFLTDHLGSTVAVTDDEGTLTSQQRYLPFGGVRADVTSPNPQFPITDFGYTGQRDLDPGMGGLMDYKFRMYSPLLGKFISPDTITPGGPQGLNRYSYVNNNPINFNDPTGHNEECSLGQLGCKNGVYTAPSDQAGSLDRVIAGFGITTSGNFSRKQKWAILRAARVVGDKFASQEGGTAQSAFRNAYSGGVNFTFGSGPAGGFDHPNAGPGCVGVSSGGCTTSPTQIDFWTMAGDGDSYGNELTRNIYNVVHELGHAYDYGHNYPSSAIPSAFAEERNLYLRPNGIDNHPVYGQFTQDNDYLNLQQNRATTPGETYGDMFVAWVFNKWNTDPFNAGKVTTAQGYMP